MTVAGLYGTSRSLSGNPAPLAGLTPDERDAVLAFLVREAARR